MPVPLNTMTPEMLTDMQQRLGLSYREMAARLGVHRNTYLNWVKGRTPPPAMAELAMRQLAMQLGGPDALKRKPTTK